MEEAARTMSEELSQEIVWTMRFFERIRSIRLEDEEKVRTVNLLINEEGSIQSSPRELALT
ncbi:MAG: hypothetical protein R2684_14495 [Pyrinomonadaceae bacterium]